MEVFCMWCGPNAHETEEQAILCELIHSYAQDDADCFGSSSAVEWADFTGYERVEEDD